jgi:hypothetical protein
VIFKNKRLVKSNRMRWAGKIERKAEMRNENKMLATKAETTKPLGDLSIMGG